MWQQIRKEREGMQVNSYKTEKANKGMYSGENKKARRKERKRRR